MLSDLILGPGNASSSGNSDLGTTDLGTIDQRLLQCGVSRRAFLQFCSSLMIAAPFGLAITDKKLPEDVATGLSKVVRPAVIWLRFQDCTGCAETLFRSSHPDLRFSKVGQDDSAPGSGDGTRAEP